MDHSLEDLIKLATDVELIDSINWEGLNVDREKIYQIIASQVYEMYALEEFDDRETIMLVTIIKLVVENFVLNIKLESGDYYGKN